MCVLRANWSRRALFYCLRMLFEQRFWPLIFDGSVTVTFRRWRRPQAVAGGRYRTPAGIIEAERVDVVTAERITDRDARRSGYPSADAVRNDLRGDESSPIYPVEVHSGTRRALRADAAD